MAEIVSASVGGMVAGNIVIPESQGASFATWPDIIKKTVDEAAGIWLDNYRGRSSSDDSELRTAPPSATMIGGGVVGLIALGALAFFLLRR